MFCFYHVFCFFFQAEDGIRDDLVTGVQTCALPICDSRVLTLPPTPGSRLPTAGSRSFRSRFRRPPLRRSEERRVGKECRSRWSPVNETTNNYHTVATT